jgi:uncharacterized protein (TIGR02246 family)
MVVEESMAFTWPDQVIGHDSKRWRNNTHSKRVLFSGVLLGAMALVAIAMPATRVMSADTGPEGQIRSATAAWNDAYNSADLDRLMALYAEDAVSMPPGRPALEGRAAIESHFQSLFATFVAHHETSIVDLELAGDLAIERGRYTATFTPKDGNAPNSEIGKYLVVRRQAGNVWRIVWEIWNSQEQLPAQTTGWSLPMRTTPGEGPY